MNKVEHSLNAEINLKEQPNRVTVNGKAWVYTEEDKVTVREAVPQGINERILLLDVVVDRKMGPMKGTLRAFHFQKVVNGRQYDQVTARFPENDEETVDVQFLG